MSTTLPRSDQEELLDSAHLDPEALRENLRDLGRVHRWGGGSRSILRVLAPRLRSWPRHRTLRILDLGTGGADLPLALVRCCRRRRIRVFITALDRCPAILGYARQQVRNRPEIALVRADALALPFLPAAFDFVLSSLLLHHILPARAPAFLRTLPALAREGAVVADLRRGRWAYLCTRVFTRVFLRGRMSRHDGPLSVRRSLTLSEAGALAADAGWGGARVRKTFPLRLILLDRPPK